MAMTKKQLLRRLVKLAQKDASHRDPFICCDFVGQENLEEIQDELATLIHDLATDTNDHRLLVKELPYTFQPAHPTTGEG